MSEKTLVLRNLAVNIDYEKSQSLEQIVAEKLRLDPNHVDHCKLLQRSLDARRRQFRYQLHVEFQVKSPKAHKKALKNGAVEVKDKTKLGSDGRVLTGLTPGQQGLTSRPVIIGSGPSGLFAAWLLAQYGYQPLILERGRRVEKRIRDVRGFERGGEFEPESNILFGEGGAGTFSDGKLTCRTKSPVKPELLRLMIECTAPDEISIIAKPHIGTDRLRAVLVHLRRKLEKMGAEFRFEARVDDIVFDSERNMTGVRLADGEVIPANVVLLGIGHSARDTYEMLLERGVDMEFKPFQLGLRVEHPQLLVDQFRYGSSAEEVGLPTAEYALKTRHKVEGRELFSFCMCPGGYVVPSVSQTGFLCTNGMSRHRRDSGWANSGLVYTLDAKDLGSDHPLAGIRAQQEIERKAFEMSQSYAVPAQRIDDFLANKITPASSLKTTYPLGHRAADLRELLPGPGAKIMAEGLKQFNKMWAGYSSAEGILVGPEARGSSPVRILRERETRESTSHHGLYPMGEGAGFAGGIMSAALDGVRTAQSVIETYAPLTT